MKNIVIHGLLLGSSMVATNLYAQKQEKPNVLFIFVDDMTYNGLNALGNSEIISPNMDRIVQNGVSFCNNYNMGGWNGAISVASRSQLITGQYLWKTHKLEKTKFKQELADHQLWAQVMRDAGYQTFQTGKWHMTAIRPEQIFDEVKVPRIGGMPPDISETYNRPLSKEDNNWLPWDESKGGYWSGGTHWSETLANVTVEYIEKNKDSQKPLFMFCAFNAPHDPRQSPKEYIEMYPVDKIKIPKNFLPEHPYCEEMNSGRNLRDEKLAPFPRTKYAIQKNRQEYYALITHLDDQIGKILKALNESGRANNTLIVFAADNGLALGSHGLMGKQSMYEHSMKIPLVFSGCGLPKGEKRTQLIYLQDLVPTIYELVGIKIPKGMDFVSQLDVLQNKKANGKREMLYGAYMDTQRMVRDERFKLVLIPRAQKAYLFDLKKDPLEMNDLYGKKKYDKDIKRLAAKYIQLSRESGDTLDIASAFPAIFVE